MRNRLVYAGAAAAVIALGLASRVLARGIPHPLAQAPGDVLWATLVFFLVGLVFPRRSTGWVGGVALALAFLVEASQLVHPPWLEAMRATVPGRLVLGTSFYAPDLVAYAVGVALGMAVERVAQGRALRRP